MSAIDDTKDALLELNSELEDAERNMEQMDNEVSHAEMNAKDASDEVDLIKLQIVSIELTLGLLLSKED